MPNYQKMYAKLFNQVTDVIEQLQVAQRQTEQIFVDSDDLELTIVKQSTEKK